MIPYVHFNPAKTTTYVADKTTARLLFALAASFNMHIKHIDINAAYLHEKFDHPGSKPVVVRQLPRFDGAYKHAHRVGKLYKNIYGTPGAGHMYLNAIVKLLRKHTFTQSEADMILFHRRTQNHIIILSIGMDYFTVISTSKHLQNTLQTFSPQRKI